MYLIYKNKKVQLRYDYMGRRFSAHITPELSDLYASIPLRNPKKEILYRLLTGQFIALKDTEDLLGQFNGGIRRNQAYCDGNVLISKETINRILDLHGVSTLEVKR